MQSNPLKDPPKIDDLIEQWALHNRPQLVNILYWFDGSQSPELFQAWREMGVEKVVKNAGHPNFNAPIFLDSGGFKLRHAHNFDLTKFGINPNTMAHDILMYQLDLGGEIIATLDYPLLSGLRRDEAERRMSRSREAARYYSLIMGSQEHNLDLPFLLVAVHGQTAEDHIYYVDRVFDEMRGMPYGFAIGSCVGAPTEVHLSKLVSTVSAIPEQSRPHTPIHIFGVSGTFMPILAYLGADTFDSFTYAHAAASHDYKNPITSKMHKVSTLNVDNLPCECYACTEGLIAAFKEASKEGESMSSDHYSALHLHNYYAEFRNLEEYAEAIEADCALEFIGEYMQKRGISENMTACICDLAPEIAKQLDRPSYIFDVSGVVHKMASDYSIGTRPVSLDLTPDSFKIDSEYRPPDGKHILLITPDNGCKPYRNSAHTSGIREHLLNTFGSLDEIHFVTLAGLYGPVPEEFEDLDAILQNCYSMTTNSIDKVQRKLVAERLDDYIDQCDYDYCLAYLTKGALRKICQGNKKIDVLPDKMKVHSKGFLAEVNLEELASYLHPLIKNKLVEQQLSIF